MTAGARRPTVLSMLRMRRLRRGIALFLSACLVAALLPWTVFAQEADPEYSGAAEGTAAEVTIGEPDAPPVEVTAGEATGAVNSEAGIIEDSPGSPENEAEDFAVGTATPVRVEVGGETVLQPGSVQSSAPADAGGSRTVIDIDEGPIDVAILEGVTDSKAATDASTASTENHSAVTDATIADGLAVIPAATGDANVSRTAGGLVSAFGSSSILAPTSLLDGLITAAAISASSTSNADGTNSSNTTDFVLADLALRSAAGEDPVVSFSARPSPTDPDLIELTINIAGEDATILTVPRGVNLLDPTTYGGSSLEAAAILGPVLLALAGPGGPLEGSEVIVGGGYSEQGDGTFARGLIEVLRVAAVLEGNTLATIVLGRAFSAADATRSSSNVTDPETPPGTPPATDPEDAFPGTEDATPAETIFTAPVATPAQTPTPTPAAPTAPAVDDAPEAPPADDDGPADEQAPAGDEDGPGAPPASGDAGAAAAGDAGPARVDAPVAAADDGELPFSGLGLAPMAAMGLLLLAGGSLVRVADRRRRLQEEASAQEESDLEALLTLEDGDEIYELVAAGER